ncbi:MAG: universal stress protein, partial [Acidimicrobiia bacterium]
TVIAVHVFEPLALLGHLPPPVDFAVAEQHAFELLRDTWCAPLTKAGVTFDVRVVEGVPGPAIVALAAESQANQIVLGSRGRSSVADLVLGSTSSYVLHHAEVPVTIVSTRA